MNEVQPLEDWEISQFAWDTAAADGSYPHIVTAVCSHSSHLVLGDLVQQQASNP